MCQSGLPWVPEAAGGKEAVTSSSLVSYREPAPTNPAKLIANILAHVSRASTQFRFPFLAAATMNMAQKQSGLCLPLGTRLAHILPPTLWKPRLFLVKGTLLDRI